MSQRTAVRKADWVRATRTNARIWASNIVASATTRMSWLVRERSRKAKRAGRAGPQRSRMRSVAARLWAAVVERAQGCANGSTIRDFFFARYAIAGAEHYSLQPGFGQKGFASAYVFRIS
jgi:hypothetical protein